MILKAILSMILVLCNSFVCAQAKADVQEFTHVTYHEVTVNSKTDASVGWIDAGIDIKPGDEIDVLNAEGTWTINVNDTQSHPYVGILGEANTGGPLYNDTCGKLDYFANNASLIAYESDNSQSFAMLGETGQMYVYYGGRLFLSVNDCVSNFSDNAGSITVSLRRTRQLQNRVWGYVTKNNLPSNNIVVGVQFGGPNYTLATIIDGKYEFENLPAGTGDFYVGYVEQNGEYCLGVADRKFFEVTNADLHGPNFNVDCNLGTLKGSIYIESRPEFQVAVDLLNKQTNEKVSVVAINNHIEIHRLKAGQYALNLKVDNAACDFKKYEALTVNQGQTIDLGNITVKCTYGVSVIASIAGYRQFINVPLKVFDEQNNLVGTGLFQEPDATFSYATVSGLQYKKYRVLVDTSPYNCPESTSNYYSKNNQFYQTPAILTMNFDCGYPNPFIKPIIIIYVHGWLGIGDESANCEENPLWYSPYNHSRYQDPLHKPLIRLLYQDMFEIYGVHWTTSKNGSMTIEDAARCIAPQIQKVKDMYAGKNVKFVILTHSMGGVNARYYLESGEFPTAAQDVAALIMMGSPNLGLQEKTKTVCEYLVSFRKVDSSSCNLNIQKDFAQLLEPNFKIGSDNLGKPNSIKYYAIVGNSSSILGGISKAIFGVENDFLIPVTSSVGLNTLNGYAITDEDHSDAQLTRHPYYGKNVGEYDNLPSFVPLAYKYIIRFINNAVNNTPINSASKSNAAQQSANANAETMPYTYGQIDITSWPTQTQAITLPLTSGVSYVYVYNQSTRALTVTLPNGTTWLPYEQLEIANTIVTTDTNVIAIAITQTNANVGQWQFEFGAGSVESSSYRVSYFYENPVSLALEPSVTQTVLGGKVSVNTGLTTINTGVTETVVGITTTVMAPDGGVIVYHTADVAVTAAQVGYYQVETQVESVDANDLVVLRKNSTYFEVIDPLTTTPTPSPTLEPTSTSTSVPVASATALTTATQLPTPSPTGVPFATVTVTATATQKPTTTSTPEASVIVTKTPIPTQTKTPTPKRALVFLPALIR